MRGSDEGEVSFLMRSDFMREEANVVATTASKSSSSGRENGFSSRRSPWTIGVLCRIWKAWALRCFFRAGH